MLRPPSRMTATVAACLALAVVAGCGTKRATQVYPPATSRDAIQQARDILELYTRGQPPGSEIQGYPSMVEGVRALDAAAADTLAAGLAEIAARPSAARDTAARLLDSLPKSGAAAAEADPGPAQ